MASHSRVARAHKACVALLFCTAIAVSSDTQTFTNLFTLEGTNGEYPLAPLVQGRDGNLYGTSAGDGISDGGTVFKITTKGVLTTLHSFEGTDGFRPYAGLVQAADGNLYGTTYNGGTSSNGTAFKITPTNRLTVLHSFCQTDCTRRFDIFWTSEIAGEGARATLAYFPAVALPSSLASIAGLEQTS